jgi:transposase
MVCPIRRNGPFAPVFAQYEIAEVRPVREGRFQLDDATAAQLQLWVTAPSSPSRLVRRSRIVLMLANGVSKSETAIRLNVSRRTVAVWEQRFLEGGAAALLRDRPGRGRPKGRSKSAVASIAAAMAHPPAGQERWTARSLARFVGVSHSTVLRVWREETAKA